MSALGNWYKPEACINLRPHNRKNPMKISLLVAGCLLAPCVIFSQVGIGTTSPNTKSILDLTSTDRGFLVPRMTWQQKTNLSLNSGDAGMMVYQTDQPALPNNFIKGLYFFDGTGWISPVNNGTTNGQTLRWDGKSWAATTNLFNAGSAIGIGTTAPNAQLQINSSATTNTRLLFTNSGTGSSVTDGLALGVTLSNSFAHLLQQENKPLWFGTNALERMRIDSAGNVGIGQTNPTARLDVNGTVRIGTTGTILNSIIKTNMEVIVPLMTANEEWIASIPCPNALEDAIVYVSPDSPLSGLMIAYARASAPNIIEVKFMNMGPTMTEPMAIMLHIAVIQ
jgi:hypothetical protein